MERQGSLLLSPLRLFSAEVGIVFAQEHCLCLESSLAALVPLCSFAKVSREALEAGEPGLTLSLISQVLLVEFLPWAWGLSLPISEWVPPITEAGASWGDIRRQRGINH